MACLSLTGAGWEHGMGWNVRAFSKEALRGMWAERFPEGFYLKKKKKEKQTKEGESSCLEINCKTSVAHDQNCLKYEHEILKGPHFSETTLQRHSGLQRQSLLWSVPSREEKVCPECYLGESPVFLAASEHNWPLPHQATKKGTFRGNLRKLRKLTEFKETNARGPALPLLGSLGFCFMSFQDSLGYIS